METDQKTSQQKNKSPETVWNVDHKFFVKLCHDEMLDNKPRTPFNKTG